MELPSKYQLGQRVNLLQGPWDVGTDNAMIIRDPVRIPGKITGVMLFNHEGHSEYRVQYDEEYIATSGSMASGRILAHEFELEPI